MRIIIIPTLLFTFSLKTESAKTGDYYLKVWEENINQCRNWIRPTNLDGFQNVKNNCEQFDAETEYDFVIVGGGTAGAILANRLSAVPKWKILLIEVGGDETDFTLMPAAYPAVMASNVSWGFLTTPQKNACKGYLNNQCDYTRGKLLGGSSSFNAFAYVRGNKNDFNKWSENIIPGWSYEEMLPYLKKIENASEVDHFNENVRGTKGPIKLEYPNPKHSLTKFMIEANKKFGLDELDYNGNFFKGISRMQVTVKDGKRCSTNQAYLNSIKNRPNLKILTETYVTKINFESKKVHNLTFIHKNKCFTVSPAKEVILSAGAINTPQLLLLSGIGPKEELQKHGIKQIVEADVGKYLEDQPIIFLSFLSNHTENFNLKDAMEDYSKGFGRIASSTKIAVSFPNVTGIEPDLEVIFGITDLYPDLYLKYSNAKGISPPPNTPPNFNSFSIAIRLLYPKSKGEITLKSTDPTDFPLINPNLLNHPDDIETLYLGIQYALKLLETNAFKGISAKLNNFPVEECKNLNEEEMWKCFIRYSAFGTANVIGTTKMGFGTKNDWVVNNKCKIKGVSKLRVVDAGIIPTANSGQAITMAVAEKASDIIKSDYIS